FLEHRRRRRLELAAHREYGRLRIGREGMGARRNAAGDLDVDELVGPGMAADEIRDERVPARGPDRIGNPDRGEAAAEARPVLRPAKRPAGVYRDYFVDT